MIMRRLGKTELEVTALGFGAGQIGGSDVSQADAERMLKAALDAGINVIDTAAIYGDSEEKIGRSLADRRDEFVLITKCGQEDPPGWTPELVRMSLERSLRRLRTDHVDVLLLHSCDEKELAGEGLLEALYQCRADGLARFIGYSGDNIALLDAIGLGTLDCVEASVNLCDQQLIEQALPGTIAADMGVISKKSIAVACWTPRGRGNPYIATYVERLDAMGFTPESLGFEGDFFELALRFSAYQEGVHVSLVGGTNLDNILPNVAAVEKGPLPEDVVRSIRAAWQEHDDGSWQGQP